MAHAVAEPGSAHEAIRLSSSYLQAVIDAIAEPLVVINREFDIVLANRAARDHTDVAADLIHPCWRCHAASHQVSSACECRTDFCPVRYVLDHGAPAIVTHTHYDRRGVPHVVEILASPIFGEDGDVCQVVQAYRDVTRRVQAEEALARHQAELARAARLKSLGEMASGMAHELNQPLAAIANYAGACITRTTRVGPRDERLLTNLKRIVEQAKRASTVVRRALNFVRPQDTARSNVDLHEIVRESVALMAHEFEQAGVAVRLELAGGALPAVADRIGLQQVVVNLLRNSLEAVEEVPVVDRHVDVRTLRHKDGSLEVQVLDTGCGLPRGSDSRLFETFFTTKPHGVGLGLAICRSIIEGHGGRIWAERRAAVGSCVMFRIPAISDDATHDD